MNLVATPGTLPIRVDSLQPPVRGLRQVLSQLHEMTRMAGTSAASSVLLEFGSGPTLPHGPDAGPSKPTDEDGRRYTGPELG